jgi:hypothetical protein
MAASKGVDGGGGLSGFKLNFPEQRPLYTGQCGASMEPLGPEMQRGD